MLDRGSAERPHDIRVLEDFRGVMGTEPFDKILSLSRRLHLLHQIHHIGVLLLLGFFHLLFLSLFSGSLGCPSR